MDNGVPPLACAARTLSPGASRVEGQILTHLAHLAEEQDRLAREVRQCHEQLNLVYDVAAQLSCLRDPDEAEADLLCRFGKLFSTGAVFLDRGGCCRSIAVHGVESWAALTSPDEVRTTLAQPIEDVRSALRAQLLPVALGPHLRPPAARVLLSPLRRTGHETGVIIALRAEPAPGFEARDALAAESVLAYGAQVLTNAEMVRHLQHSALETVCSLVNAIDAKDNYTASHAERVGGYALRLGKTVGLPKSQLQALEWAGLLHDIGKIGVPESVLNKPRRFDDAERAQMRKHPQIGHDVLRPVGQFASVLEAVLWHHENHDGSGYPEGRCGREIPVDARIIHVVDIFDALTTARPYRSAFSFKHAARLLERGSGATTDPEMTNAFLDLVRRELADHPAEFRARFGHAPAPAALPTPGALPCVAVPSAC